MQTLTKQTLKIFWQHAKQYKLAAFCILTGLVLVTATTTYTPVLYRNLINLLTENRSPETLSKAINLVWFIILVGFLRLIFWRATNFVNNYFQPRVMANLTFTCYEYLLKHSYNFFSSSFVGSLVTKVKRYEKSFEKIADQISFDLGRSILDTGMITAVLFFQYPKFGVVVLLWCIIFTTFAYKFSLYKMPYDLQRAASDTKTTAQLADSITNNINIKLFTNYTGEGKAFKEVVENQFRLRKLTWDLGTIGDLVQTLLMLALELYVIYSAVLMWSRGEITVGDIALLQAFLFRIFDKLWNMGKNIRDIYEALADANEMTEIITSPHEVDDVENAKPLKIEKGNIDFINVNFSYKNKESILKKFNLSIKDHEKVALIGPSGGGKTTIVKLLFRFMDIQSGKIVIDSQDISKVTQDSLREQVSLVPQEPILFHRSLLENIRYGKPTATENEVIQAAKMAHAHEFISKFSEGYETLVGERGIKLSGGQRQRVAIARAILKNSPILILDEATSSLDSESEQLIQDALKNLMKNKTVIVIAHRLSTIMQMDRIIVLENGKITEEGMHEELVKAKQGTYQKLWNIQAGSFNN